MDIRHILFSIIALLIIARTATGSPAEARQYLTAGSVRLIENSEKPLEGVLRPKLTEIWSAGDGSEREGNLLNKPAEIRVIADGTVFVLDIGDGRVRIFDDTGKLVREFGRTGQGPGEFNALSYFDVDPEGRIAIHDHGNRQVTLFDRDGTFQSSFLTEKFATQVKFDPAGRIVLGEIVFGEPELTSDLKRIQRTLTLVSCEADGRNPRRIGPFRHDAILMQSGGKNTVVMFSSPDAAQTGWGIAPDGRIWAGHNETYEIGVYDPDGTPLFRFGRAYRPEKNREFRRVKPELRKISPVPKFLPAFHPELFFDDASLAWIPLFRAAGDKGGPYRYDVFSPEGVYLKQVVVPFRIYQVRKDRMYAIVETEEGFRVLKCYRFE